MSEHTEFRKRTGVGKTLSLWLGIIIAAGGIGVSLARSYFITPLKLDEHDRKIERLERNAEELRSKLQEQREFLIEIRGDLKALNRASRIPVRPENN